jgi:hypothetical protein
MKKYFYTDGTNKYGPYSKDELLLQKITRNTKIWYLGIDKWTELSNIQEFDDFTLSIPPEIKKSKTNNQKIIVEKPLSKHSYSFDISKILANKTSIFVFLFLLVVSI